MSKKQIAIIILLIIGLVILGIGVYLLFIKKPTTSIIVEPNFPIGNSTSTPNTTTPIDTATSTDYGTTITNGSTASEVKVLFKLSLAPVAGSGFSTTKFGSSTVATVRYSDKAAGHTYEIFPVGTYRTRITNTTIPKIAEAFYAGTNIIFRRITGLDDVQTQVGKLTTVGATTTITTATIPSEMTTLAISPKKDQLFFIRPNTDGTGTAVIAASTGSGPKELVTLPLSEWTAQWPTDTTVTLTTKPSNSARGHMYFLHTKTATLNKILGNVAGLATLTNPAGTVVLYSDTTGTSPILRAYDITKKTTLALSLPTLADKCVWSSKTVTIAYCAVPNDIPSTRYPDAWYQGKVLFTDAIYKIDVAAQSTTLLYNLPGAEAIDAIDLSIDPTDQYLTFMNKRDYFLWSLSVGLLAQQNQ